MAVKVINFKKKLLWGSAILLVALAGTAGSALYMITRPFDMEFAQEPNAVEAHEANRKLKLLNEAQTTQKRGFVRFSEVEINSFLAGRYNAVKAPQTNGPVRLVKSGVLLGRNSATFVTWHEVPILGMDLPIVWQRTVTSVNATNTWKFNLESMRLGQLDVPAQYWEKVTAVLGTADSLFQERKDWLNSLPLVTLAQNEISKSPEFRLYSYLPTEKGKAETR